MARKIKVVEEEYEPLTPQQQEFVTLLVAGYSITDAANQIGLSRRAVTYWLHAENSPVHGEYERLRREAIKALRERTTNLYELVFKALEDMLSESAPPEIRWRTVKMLFEARIQALLPTCTLPMDTLTLVKAEAARAHETWSFDLYNIEDMNHIPET